MRLFKRKWYIEVNLNKIPYEIHTSHKFTTVQLFIYLLGTPIVYLLQYLIP